MQSLWNKIEQTAKLFPYHTAIQMLDQQISYSDLIKYTQKLSQWIISKLNNKANAIVAVVMNPGIEQTLALMAIHKAGLPYLPINPSFPKRYLRHILFDANPSIILTNSESSENMKGLSQNVFHIHSIPLENQNTDDHLPFYSDLFAIIYTSGSTGQPKGTLITRSGIQNRLNWMCRFTDISSSDIVAQKTSFCFDVSIWEFFLPLMVGATISIVDSETRKDPYKLIDHVHNHRCSILHFVPSQFSKQLSCIESDPELAKCFTQSLRLILFSGEALHSNLIKRFDTICHHQKKPIQMANLYGPTEASIDVTAFPIETDYRSSGFIPIGKPIDNTTVLVLDANKDICQPNEIGEIYIAGICLAKGYLNQPIKTAESFPTININNEGARRYFKSGDLAKQDQTGLIHFIGRKDSQIKIRGFRVELNGIRDLLLEHPDIKNASVHVLSNSQEDQYIVVFYVSDKDGIHPKLLRDYLSKSLPDYHLPHQFVKTDHIPLTLHGKIDQSALLKQFNTSSNSSSNLAAPKNKIEKTMVSIWEKVFAIKISTDDDFYALGGDSITAMSICIDCRRLGIRGLDTGTILNNRTIANIARVIKLSGETKKTEENQQPPLQEMNGSMPLEPFQAHIVFTDRFFPENHLFTQMGCIKFNDPQNILNKASIEKSLNILIKRHEALRIILDPSSNLSKQRVLPFQFCESEIPIILKFSSLTHLSVHEFDEALMQIVDFEKSRGIHLDEFPLFRFRLIFGPEGSKYLLSSMHHLIIDGWSQAILMEELVSLVTKKSPENIIYPQAGYFSDYLKKRQNDLNPHSLKEMEDYWNNTIQSSTQAIRFPKSFPDSKKKIRRFFGKKISSCFSSQLTQKIVRKSQNLGVTMAAYLMGFFFIYSHSFIEDENALLFTNIALRDLLDEDKTGRVVGSLVNQVPIVLSSNTLKNKTRNEIIIEVNRILHEACRYGKLPLKNIQHIIRSKTGVDYNGSFNIPVNFSFRNEPTPKINSILTYKTVTLPITSPEIIVSSTMNENILSINWSYPEDLYLPNQIEDFSNNYQSLILSEVNDEQII